MEEILVYLVNEYVEKFIEDVDCFKVYIVSNVMICLEIVNFEKDGFCVVFKWMCEVGIFSVFVVKCNCELVGIVYVVEVFKLVKENIILLEIVLYCDVFIIGLDMLFVEIMDIILIIMILIVVIEDGKLKGIIICGFVLVVFFGNEVNVNV